MLQINIMHIFAYIVNKNYCLIFVLFYFIKIILFIIYKNMEISSTILKDLIIIYYILQLFIIYKNVEVNSTILKIN